jgi:hypothetical protein
MLFLAHHHLLLESAQTEVTKFRSKRKLQRVQGQNHCMRWTVERACPNARSLEESTWHGMARRLTARLVDEHPLWLAPHPRIHTDTSILPFLFMLIPIWPKPSLGSLAEGCVLPSFVGMFNIPWSVMLPDTYGPGHTYCQTGR